MHWRRGRIGKQAFVGLGIAERGSIPGVERMPAAVSVPAAAGEEGVQVEVEPGGLPAGPLRPESARECLATTKAGVMPGPALRVTDFCTARWAAPAKYSLSFPRSLNS